MRPSVSDLNAHAQNENLVVIIQLAICANAVHASIGYADAIQVGDTVNVSGVVARGETLEQ